jgi:para-nitrobenzyl esterase
MQARLFPDMSFRSNAMSEDCLYLNVWTPARSAQERLPVLVYFFGGGFLAGDGSEARYDGESMATKGIVVVTVNYRLGVFGFLAYPELTNESRHHASGNYGLLDQHAALRWVQQSIAAFGGDPRRVTIAGESAGSISVSALMVSPLSKDLIAGAIGESGSILGTLAPVPLSQAEQVGVRFANQVGANSLAALRRLNTDVIFEEATRGGLAAIERFPLALDGYFLPEEPAAIYNAGRQARVPLLVGWNSQERGWQVLLGGKQPTPENYAQAVHAQLGQRADEALRLYPAMNTEDVIKAATDLASDRFTGYSTWKWADLQARTGDTAVYRYFYTRPRPATKSTTANGTTGPVPISQDSTASPPARGAIHSAEIEYALGNLLTNNVYAWTPDDHKVSKVMQDYFANFITTGDPNGSGLPTWPKVNGSSGSDAVQVMRIDVDSRPEPERHRERYVFLDRP